MEDQEGDDKDELKDERNLRAHTDGSIIWSLAPHHRNGHKRNETPEFHNIIMKNFDEIDSEEGAQSNDVQE